MFLVLYCIFSHLRRSIYYFICWRMSFKLWMLMLLSLTLPLCQLLFSWLRFWPDINNFLWIFFLRYGLNFPLYTCISLWNPPENFEFSLRSRGAALQQPTPIKLPLTFHNWHNCHKSVNCWHSYYLHSPLLCDHHIASHDVHDSYILRRRCWMTVISI